jgi:hypothetical protein
MSVWRKLVRSNFFIKLKSWEYWPFGVVHFPSIIYYIWLSIRARSFIFFSASNPGIPMGGMFGESKYDVLKKIPHQYIPKTVLIRLPSTVSFVTNTLTENNFDFPLIAKPDLGERGFMVCRINDDKDIEEYLKKVKIDFLVQELVNLPMEFGVFYLRFPGKECGMITSITMKEMLTVTGDGRSTLRDLIANKDRAKLHWDRLKIMHRNRLDAILAEGDTIELVSIGNHCLGTKFINANHLINGKLSETFDSISKQIDGFYFGRFDLRCESLNDLYNGKIKIMELNGCGAEPAHIYNPGYSFFKAMSELLAHWRNIFLISRENNRKGVPYTTAKEALKYYKAFKAAQL